MMIVVAILLGLILLALLNRKAADDVVFYGLGCSVLLLAMAISIAVGGWVFAAVRDAPGIFGGLAVIAGGVTFFGIGHFINPAIRALFPRRFAELAAREQRREAAIRHLREGSYEG